MKKVVQLSVYIFAYSLAGVNLFNGTVAPDHAAHPFLVVRILSAFALVLVTSLLYLTQKEP